MFNDGHARTLCAPVGADEDAEDRNGATVERGLKSSPTDIAAQCAVTRAYRESSASRRMRRERASRPRTVQDALTIWERTIYKAMWVGGAEQPDGSRTMCAGYRTLAKQNWCSAKTIKVNLRSLQKKLTIESIAPEESFTSTARTYRIYSYRQILKRWRAAGLDTIVRKGHGVLLATAAPLEVNRTGEMAAAVDLSHPGRATTGARTIRDTVNPASPTRTAGVVTCTTTSEILPRPADETDT